MVLLHLQLMIRKPLTPTDAFFRRASIRGRFQSTWISCSAPPDQWGKKP